MKAGLFAVTLVIGSLVAFVPSGLAEGEGQLFFTDTLLLRDTTAPDCPEMNTYAMSTSPLAEAKKAYAGPSWGVLGCPVAMFDYAATSSLVLSGTAVAHFWYACDVGSLSFGTPVSSSGILNLYINGESTGTGKRFVHDNACASGETYEVTVAGVALGDKELKPGDVLRVEFVLFAFNTPAAAVPNLHILVGGDTPSSLLAAGLPLPSAGGASGAAELALAATEPAAEGAAGESVTYSLTIENSGSGTASYALTASGLPEGYEATFSEAEGEVAAGENASSELSIAIPSGAAAGDYTFEVQATYGDASTATTELTLTVADASSSGGSSATTEPSTSEGPATSGAPEASNATDSGEPQETEAEEKDTPGLGAFAMLAVAAMAVVLLRRKR